LTGSIVKTSSWSIEVEDQEQHLLRLIKDTAQTEDWYSDITSGNFLEIYKLEDIESIWIQGATVISLYRRQNLLTDMALGNAQKQNELKMVIELTSGNKNDFKVVKRLLEELFWAQDSVNAAINNAGRTERRWRLILNSQDNLSDVMSRMFREVMEVTMKTYVVR